MILHCDLNNFYASVECAENPSLRDMPMVVGGDESTRHGIVLAKSQSAKAFGIFTGETLHSARQKCPNLKVVLPNMALYEQYSKLAHEIYNRYTDQVEAFGIDECWLDVTHCQKYLGLTPQELADKIREDIKRELNGCTISVGVSFNKIFSKLGSDLKKPDATTVIDYENFKYIVYPLPIQDLMYVGKSTQKFLNLRNIHTIGQIVDVGESTMKDWLGKRGTELYNYASGNDKSPVKQITLASTIKSMSHSTTTRRDITSDQDFLIILTRLAESISTRLRNQNLKGTTLTLSIKDSNFAIWQKQCTILATNLAQDMIHHSLILKQYCNIASIRSVGINISNQKECKYTQLSFFDSIDVKTEIKEKTIDSIRLKHGKDAIKTAITIVDESI